MNNSVMDSNKKISRLISCFLITLVIMFAMGSGSSADEEKLVGKTVNINTATVEQFIEVPLITRELAESIVEYREMNGDFQVIEELLQIDGFTRTLLRKIKGFLLLEGLGGDECAC